jgi:hypothetical protein
VERLDKIFRASNIGLGAMESCLVGKAVYLGKSWFLDRMVRLYDEMKDAYPQYKKWLY